MEFSNYLKHSAKSLEKEIQKILNLWFQEAQKIDKSLIPPTRAFIEACKGGKKIRGTLIKLGYELVRRPKGAESGEILRVGAAYEIFHTAILVHDDIIDESPTRRDQKSLYKSVGMPQAITLADSAFFLATKIISESKFDIKIKHKALNLFLKTMIDTTTGQMLDITGNHKEITDKFKTARYTISGPLRIGAILGGANDKLLGLLERLGDDLGLVYQIRDDILDGEAKSVKKAKIQVLKYRAKAGKLIPEIAKDDRMVNLLEEMTSYLVQRTK
ncbi:hypothetical protein A3C26_01575 [Candidatus Daviesbacteria bacterium RIFCSPHIGHO2_02_FULL_39_12]|uniref:Polyprenyl synthetase n=2 Tax=Candidatus Daviesiibacteriota TaxID=1752718 RepID=A0A1F5JCW3_9BACT|nr:MAG: hypothetical protein A3C26_01575 [Candidatus Daviesbacteria bacterium RIFCSPHIGHO2_02_FULL_39_12]OGE72867.1 MAG: hypothetical protein A3H40_01815 [Candidatus Daviesbacteria bacterium RIFCSPLOWO2_02_FULL_38_15]